MISVDTRKKENVGEFKNGGREWRPEARAGGVRTHDFPDEQLGKAIPYRVYDLAANAGWVPAGTDHDTPAFAVESIRRWWNAAGRAAYPGARRLLITADAGGSNGYRTRAWKAGLAAFALQTGLAVTVCHFPPGTSKWNRMSQPDWAQLTDALVIPYQAHREAGLHIARGGPAGRKPAGGYPATLSLPEMILATICGHASACRYASPPSCSASSPAPSPRRSVRSGRSWTSAGTSSSQPERTSRLSPTSPRSRQHTASRSSREPKPLC